MKKNRFRSLALAGVFSALALVFLWLTVTPVATVGTAALAAVCGIPVVVEAGRRAALIHFVTVAALAWLLIPAAEGKLLYTAFFGWYTVFKAWLEQKQWSRSTEWSIKISLFLLAIGGCGTAGYFLLTPTLPGWAAWWMLPIAAVLLVAILVVYDYALTGLVGTYMLRLRPILRRIFK